MKFKVRGVVNIERKIYQELFSDCEKLNLNGRKEKMQNCITALGPE